MPQITLILSDGTHQVIDTPKGLSVMEALRSKGVPVVGECNGSLACATCHVVVDPAWYAKLPDISDAEEDMLDSAFNVTPTSRLACQIMVRDDTDGLTLRLP